MGLSCRREILFHPEVNFQFAILEPAAAACRVFGTFCGLRNSQDALIEFPHLALPAVGHSEHNVTQPASAHRLPSVPSLGSRRSSVPETPTDSFRTTEKLTYLPAD